jgi:hypothetical protein
MTGSSVGVSLQVSTLCSLRVEPCE